MPSFRTWATVVPALRRRKGPTQDLRRRSAGATARRWVYFLAAALTWTALALAAPTRPRWIETGKSDDSIFCYRVGFAEGVADPSQARQAAYEAALRALTEELAQRAGLPVEDRTEAAARVKMPGAEIMAETAYYEPPSSCWAMVRIPLADRAQALKELEGARSNLLAATARGAELNAVWDNVRSLGAQGQTAAALSQATNLLAGLPGARQLQVTPDDIQLFIGDLQVQRGATLEARLAYDSVLGTSSNPAHRADASRKLAALPPPPLAWPLKARLGGRRLAVACWRQSGAEPAAPFPQLSDKLMQVFRDIQVEVVPLAFAAPALDESAQQTLAQQAGQTGAEVILAVGLTVDPTLTGTTTEVAGFPMPAMDTLVDIAVLRPDGTLHFRDTLRDVTGRSAPTKAADRLSSLVIKNYLLKKLSALPAPSATPTEEIDAAGPGTE